MSGPNDASSSEGRGREQSESAERREPGRSILTRRRFLASAVGVGAVVTAEAVWWEPGRFSVTVHQLGTPTPGREPLRVVQLSDLHLKRLRPFHERVAAAVGELSPDVIVLSGDALDRADSLTELDAFLALLPATPHRIATLGNWEYWCGVSIPLLSAMYETRGFRLLVNEAVEVGPVRIVGLDDWVAGTIDVDAATAGIPMDDRTLVVSHCPAWRDEPEARLSAPALTLSGHTHGGQIAAGRWSPFCPPGSGRYVSGWYRDEGAPLYVSRGLGTSLVPVRLGSVPEIAVFDWYVS